MLYSTDILFVAVPSSLEFAEAVVAVNLMKVGGGNDRLVDATATFRSSGMMVTFQQT